MYSWWQTCLQDVGRERVRYDMGTGQYSDYANLLPHGAHDHHGERGPHSPKGMQAVQSLPAHAAPPMLGSTPEVPLPASAPRSRSRVEGPLARYREWDSIRAALETGDTVLIRGSWVEQVYYSGESLPCRQDLPDDAIWKVEDLMQDVQDYKRPTPQILALSHCWLSDEHPDPENFNLYTFAPLLRHFAQSCRVSTDSVAIFYDWCSLPQEPRDEAQEESFKRAMNYVELWYSHWKSQVWLLTGVPEEVSLYKERGWCHFERALATMALPTDQVLDLGALRQNWQNWTQVVRECQAPKMPPATPEQFDNDLYKRSFKHEEDRELCVPKYTEVFQEVMGSVTELWYGGLGWSDFEAEKLALVLPLCTELREIELRGNIIADAGAYSLADALSQCPKLQVLDLEGNVLDRDGLRELGDAWVHAGKTSHYLKLGDQQTKPTSTAALKAAAFRAGHSDRQTDELSAAQLTSLVARQAAFEARVMQAVSKMTGGLDEVADSAGLTKRELAQGEERAGPTSPMATHLRL